MRPTQRTMARLRKDGCKCAVVERFNPYAGPHGIRQDMFGFIDVVALDHERGCIGIQCCAGSGFSAHYRKITEDCAEDAKDWLLTPGCRLEIWAWRKTKLKRGGKAIRWKPRIAEITLKELKAE